MTQIQADQVRLHGEVSFLHDAGSGDSGGAAARAPAGHEGKHIVAHHPGFLQVDAVFLTGMVHDTCVGQGVDRLLVIGRHSLRVLGGRIAAGDLDTMTTQVLEDAGVNGQPFLKGLATVGDLVFVAEEIDLPAHLSRVEKGIDRAGKEAHIGHGAGMAEGGFLEHDIPTRNKQGALSAFLRELILVHSCLWKLASGGLALLSSYCLYESRPWKGIPTDFVQRGQREGKVFRAVSS